MQDTGTSAISIIVNGEERTVRAGETVTDLIRALELDPGNQEIQQKLSKARSR